MVRGETANTTLVYVFGERVRLDADRPAAYLKMIADVPAQYYAAFQTDDRLIGLRDTAIVAASVTDGTKIVFRSREHLAGLVGDSPAADQPRTTIFVNKQPVTVGPTTTVADLRAAASVPDHTVAMVRDHDAGQVYTLTDTEAVLDTVRPGGAIAFYSEPDQ